MYLDPGTGSLFIQALFAILATVVTAFSRVRLWLHGMWARAIGGVSRTFRRRKN
jgi:hypothetical protein